MSCCVKGRELKGLCSSGFSGPERFYPNILVHLGKGNLEITLMFEMETKFNYIALLPERRVVRLVSTQMIAVPVQPGADSGSGSVFFSRRTFVSRLSSCL